MIVGQTWARGVVSALLALSMICGVVFVAAPAAAATPRPAAAAPTPVTTGVPRFEAGPCVYELADGVQEGANVTCGFAIVPERRGANNGKTIRLPVAVYKSLSPTPAAEPIVLLAGGPRQSGQVFANLLNPENAFYRQVLANNDVVFFDQRGIGDAQPSLACTELGATSLSQLPLLRAFQESQFVMAINRCRDRLVGQGIDLTGYTTTENAADVNDIRRVLGYERINIVGASYGTELGLAVARDFPQTVRTNGLVSIVPIQISWFFEPPQSFDRALNELFRDCAANAACNAANPDLRAAFQRAVARLNATPVLIPLKDPASGRTVEVPLTGTDFTAVLFQFFYATTLAPFLPDMITRTARGDTVWLQNLLPLILQDGGDGIALGMHFSIVCSKNASQERLERALAADEGILPEVRAALEPQVKDYYTICSTWPSRGADPKGDVPATSDRPTVLISGQFDPITPPSYADLAKQTLSNATSVTLPGAGHSAITGGDPVQTCGRAIILRLIADPSRAPDISCAAQLRTVYRALPASIAGGDEATPTPTRTPAPTATAGATRTPTRQSSPTPTMIMPGLPNTGYGPAAPGAPGSGEAEGLTLLFIAFGLGAGGATVVAIGGLRRRRRAE